MKLTKYFWISLIIILILSFVPYIITYNYPDFDGQAKIGFPFTFYSYGGEILGGNIYQSFDQLYLVLDLVIAIIASLSINIINNIKRLK